jgi:hypothetical protein
VLPSEAERDLQLLAGELKRLEAEYTMYFGGRLPRPPLEARARVEALIKRLDRGAFEQVAQRFRFQTLQSRFATFADLWDRTVRQREEGRPSRVPGPASQAPSAVDHSRTDRVLHVTSLDRGDEGLDQLEPLYEAMMEARRETGQSRVPFHRFAQVVREQVQQFRDEGAREVTLRVALREGKVRLTARATKTVGE